MKRRFFSSIMVLVLILAIMSVFTACNKNDKKELFLFNWTYYTPDDVIAQFEQEFGVKVHVDNFASNEEMFAKLKAGASGYDIVFPSQDYASIMISEGMLKELDHSKLPNLKYITPLTLKNATYDDLRESGLETLPMTLGEAIEAYQDDKFVEEVLGSSIFNKMLDAKRKEWKDFRTCVTQWEIGRYLNIF